MLIRDTEVQLGIVVHKFLSGNFFINGLSCYPVDEFGTDVFRLLSSWKDVGMLFNAVVIDYCCEADCVSVLGI